MIDDGTMFRLAPNKFRFIGGDDTPGCGSSELAEQLGLVGA